MRSHGYLASILFREYTALKLLFEQDKAACILLPDESVFTALQPASSLLVTIESLDSDCVEARHMVGLCCRLALGKYRRIINFHLGMLLLSFRNDLSFLIFVLHFQNADVEARYAWYHHTIIVTEIISVRN